MLEAEAKDRQRTAGGGKSKATAGTDSTPVERRIRTLPQFFGEAPASPSARAVLVDGSPYVEQPDRSWKTPDGKYPASAAMMARWQRQGRISEGTAGHEHAAAGAQADTGTKDKHAGEAVQQAAKLMGTNRQYVADAKKLKEQDPDAFAKVKAGTEKLGTATKRLKAKKLTKREEREEREAADQRAATRRAAKDQKLIKEGYENLTSRPAPSLGTTRSPGISRRGTWPISSPPTRGW